VILRAENLHKRFETAPVLRGASLALDAGDVVLVTGRNGSGKTTLARILATLLEPDAGQVQFDGRPLRSARRDARRAIGFASHQPLLYAGLTPLENLTLFGSLAGVAAPAARAAELLERFHMISFARTPLERFSRGMVQRVALSRAFLGEPRLLLLDEPYAGLDDDGTEALNTLIWEAKRRGAATLLVSHDRGRLGSLGTRFCRVEQGRVEEGA
jgi:heme ABC exporter ATP-binding subunit CcmA